MLYGCGRSGQLHVTRCVLRKESCVLSVAREGTGQHVAAMRQMEKGNCVSDGRASGSNDWQSCGATSGRNFKKGANMLIKWTTTLKSNHLPCQLTTMRKGPVKITIMQRRLMA